MDSSSGYLEYHNSGYLRLYWLIENPLSPRCIEYMFEKVGSSDSPIEIYNNDVGLFIDENKNINNKILLLKKNMEEYEDKMYKTVDFDSNCNLLSSQIEEIKEKYKNAKDKNLELLRNNNYPQYEHVHIMLNEAGL